MQTTSQMQTTYMIKYFHQYNCEDEINSLSFNQDDVKSTSNDKTLKLVDHFTDICSNISFTENEIKKCTGKVLTDIDW